MKYTLIVCVRTKDGDLFAATYLLDDLLGDLPAEAGHIVLQQAQLLRVLLGQDVNPVFSMSGGRGD